MQVILSNPYYSLQISIIIKLYTMYLAKDICQAISTVKFTFLLF